MYGIVPFRSQTLANVFKGMDDMFRRSWYDLPLTELTGDLSGDWMTPVDLTEDKETITVKAEMPGIDKKDIDLTVKDGYLTIRGEKKEETEETDKHFHRVERCYGSFVRTLRLPTEVSEDKIDASFKDGVLTVTLPKTGEEIKKITHVEIH